MFHASPNRKQPDQLGPDEPTVEITTEDSVRYRYRVARYLHYGFSEASAGLLAAAKADSGFVLDHNDVKKQLDRGATLEWCVRYYT
jgi:hypothetical protein